MSQEDGKILIALARTEEKIEGIKEDTTGIIRRLDKNDERFSAHGERITRVETRLNGQKRTGPISKPDKSGVTTKQLLYIIGALVTVLGSAIALAAALI